MTGGSPCATALMTRRVAWVRTIAPVKGINIGIQLVMQGVDIVRRGLGDDEQAVRAALEGNLCRCTGYQNIVDAILDVARNAPASCGHEGDRR